MKVEDYPFPEESLGVMIDLHQENRLSESEFTVLTKSLCYYMELRAAIFEGQIIALEYFKDLPVETPPNS